jgi:hypothetical protein
VNVPLSHKHQYSRPLYAHAQGIRMYAQACHRVFHHREPNAYCCIGVCHALGKAPGPQLDKRSYALPHKARCLSLHNQSNPRSPRSLRSLWVRMGMVELGFHCLGHCLDHRANPTPQKPQS